MNRPPASKLQPSASCRRPSASGHRASAGWRRTAETTGSWNSPESPTMIQTTAFSARAPSSMVLLAGASSQRLPRYPGNRILQEEFRSEGIVELTHRVVGAIVIHPGNADRHRPRTGNTVHIDSHRKAGMVREEFRSFATFEVDNLNIAGEADTAGCPPGPGKTLIQSIDAGHEIAINVRSGDSRCGRHKRRGRHGQQRTKQRAKGERCHGMPRRCDQARCSRQGD